MFFNNSASYIIDFNIDIVQLNLQCILLVIGSQTDTVTGDINSTYFEIIHVSKTG